MQVATDVRAHRRCCSQSAKARLVVISDQQRGVFVEFADQVEQQLASGLAERQIAEFVDDDEIVAQQLLGQSATTTGGFLLLQLIDEIDQIEEASSGAGANDRRGHGDA